MLWASGVSCATYSVALSGGGDIEAYVTKACSPSSTGAIDLQIKGGVAPFEVIYFDENGVEKHGVIVDEVTSTKLPDGLEDKSDLSPGLYTIKVTDGNCSVAMMAVEVGVSEPIVISATPDPICSQSNDGAINPTISGGSGKYTFMWSNGMSTQNISGLRAGSFTITVTDDGGCSAVKQFEIGTKIIKTEWIKVIEHTMASSCSSWDQNGAIEVQYVGPEVLSVQFLWNTGATTKRIENLNEGNYSLIVIVNGCNSSPIHFNICSCDGCYEESGDGFGVYYNGSCQQNHNVLILGTVTDATNQNSNDGKIHLRSKSTIPPHTNLSLSWSGPNGFKSDQWHIENLLPGTYIVTVKVGCESFQQSYIVGFCSPPNVKILKIDPCVGVANGSIRVEREKPEDYIIWEMEKQPFDRFSLIQLSPGTYCFDYIRGENCKKRECVTLLEKETNIDLSLGEITPICANQKNGIITVTLQNPLEHVSLDLNQKYVNLGTSFEKMEHTFFNLSPGNHTIIARAQCETKNYTFNIPAIAITHSIDGQVINGIEGPNVPPTGEISVVAKGGSGNYSYSWNTPGNPGQYTTNIKNLKSGNYTVVVTDLETGCSISKQFYVKNELCPKSNFKFSIIKTDPKVPFVRCKTDLCTEPNCVEAIKLYRDAQAVADEKQIPTFPLKFELYQFESNILETVVINNLSEYENTKYFTSTLRMGNTGKIVKSVDPYYIKISDACNSIQILEYISCPKCNVFDNGERRIFDGGLEVTLFKSCSGPAGFLQYSPRIEFWLDSPNERKWTITFPDYSTKVINTGPYKKWEYIIKDDEFNKLLDVKVERSDGNCVWEFQVYFGKSENVSFFRAKKTLDQAFTGNGTCEGCPESSGKPKYDYFKPGEYCDDPIVDFKVFAFKPNNTKLGSKLEVCNSGGQFDGYIINQNNTIEKRTIIVPKDKCLGIAEDNGGHSVFGVTSNTYCSFGGGCLFKADDLFPGFQTKVPVELTWCDKSFEIDPPKFPDYSFDPEGEEEQGEGDEECPKSLTFSIDEKGGKLRIFSPVEVSSAKLVVTPLGIDKTITISKGVTFEFLDNLEDGNYTATLTVEGCNTLTRNFEVSSDCPGITLTSISGSGKTTIKINSPTDIPGSKVLVLKSGNVHSTKEWNIKKGDDSFPLDLTTLSVEGFLEIKVVLGNSCGALSRFYQKDIYCPQEGELNSKKESNTTKFYPYIYSDIALDATFVIKGPGGAIVYSKAFKVEKDKTSPYIFEVNNSSLPKGQYSVTVNIINKDACDIGWFYTVYENLISCDDDVASIIYNETEGNYEAFYKQSFYEPNVLEEAKILSSGDFIESKSYPSILLNSKDQVLKDGDNSIYVLTNKNDIVSITGYNSSGDENFNSSLGNENLKAVSFDKNENKIHLVTSNNKSDEVKLIKLDLNGDVSEIKILPVKSLNPSIIHHSENTTIVFTQYNNEFVFADENNKIIKKLNSEILVKGINTLENGNILVAGEFNGNINIGGKAFNSDGHKNAIFIQYDKQGNIKAVQSEQNYRDESVHGMATKGSSEVAYYGKYIEVVSYAPNPEENIIDSCNFVLVISLEETPCENFTSTLTSQRTPCQLTWNAPPAGYTTELQWNENGIWIEVSSIGLVAPGYTSPFTVLKDGTYRLIHKKVGCPDVVSNSVTTTCHGICVCPAPVLSYDNQACHITWSTEACPGYTSRLQRQNANGGWDDIALTAASPYTVTAAGIYRVMLTKPGCSQVLSNVVTTTACSPSTNPCTCTNASQLTLNTAACSLSWNTPSCSGYTSILQRFVAGAWTTINSTSPYAIPANNNGQYRVLTSKPGCGDLVSNVVSASCSCSSPASITVFNSTYGLGQNVNLQKSQTYMHNVTSGHPNVCDDQFIELRFDANVVNSNWNISGTVGILPATVVNGYFTFTVILPDPPSSGYGDIWLQSPCGDFYTLRLVYDCVSPCVPINVNVTGIVNNSCQNLTVNATGGTAPYTYQITGTGTQSTPINQNGSSNVINLSSLHSGEAITLSITVTDANGCTGEQSVIYLRCNTGCTTGTCNSTPPVCNGLLTSTSGYNEDAIINFVVPQNVFQLTLNFDPDYFPQVYRVYHDNVNIINVPKIYRSNNPPSTCQQNGANVLNSSHLLPYELVNIGDYASKTFSVTPGDLITIDINHPACTNASAWRLRIFCSGTGSRPFEDEILMNIENVRNDIEDESLSNAFQLNDLIRFYPNPFSKGINMEFTAPQSDVMKMEVYNQVGIQVFTKTIDLMPGINLRYIDEFENMPSGVYTVKMRGTQSEHNTRVIKIE